MGKKQILVVDDSSSCARSSRTSSQRPRTRGRRLCENGKVGLQRVRELKPDAILLDLEMPEMSGIDMLKRLMLLGKAKVIVVSSVGQTGSPQAMERDGSARSTSSPSRRGR